MKNIHMFFRPGTCSDEVVDLVQQSMEPKSFLSGIIVKLLMSCGTLREVLVNDLNYNHVLYK